MTTPEQKKKNLRMALLLVSIALVFLLGFVIKMLVLSGQWR